MNFQCFPHNVGERDKVASKNWTSVHTTANLITLKVVIIAITIAGDIAIVGP